MTFPSRYRQAARRSRSALIAFAALVVAFQAVGAVGTPRPVEAQEAHTIELPIDPARLDDVYWRDTWGAPRSGGRSHIGVDMMGPKMVPLRAVADSVVDWGRFNNSRGTIVRLRDAAGWEYQYIHINNDTPGTDDGSASCLQALVEKLCSTLESDGDLKKGVSFEAGEIIGYLGDSGNAEWTGAHLHFEVYQPDGSGSVSPVNPTPFVDGAKLRFEQGVGPVGPWASAEAAADAIYRRVEGRGPSSSEASQVRNSATAGGVEQVLVDLLSTNPAAASIDRLYLAFFQRQADNAGLENWLTERAAGQRLEDIAEWFAQSTEFETRYGGLEFEDFLDQLYLDVLNRTPDEAGKEYWLGELQADRVNRGTVVVFFTESIELKTKARFRTELNVLHRAFALDRPTEEQLQTWQALRQAEELGVAVAQFVSDLD